MKISFCMIGGNSFSVAKVYHNCFVEVNNEILKSYYKYAEKKPLFLFIVTTLKDLTFAQA